MNRSNSQHIKKNMASSFTLGQRLLLFILVATLIVFNSGCALLAVSLESFRKAGLTTESRKELLPPVVSRFSDSLSWIDATKALAFASDDFKPEFKQRLLKDREKVKVIDIEILLTDYNDDATRAEINVRTKFYRIPVYIAEEKMEKQIWIYDGGWKLDDIIHETS